MFVEINPSSLIETTMDQPFRLDQKAAIITGGGSGIGERIARTFASAGARVHILDFDARAGHRVAEAMDCVAGYTPCATITANGHFNSNAATTSLAKSH